MRAFFSACPIYNRWPTEEAVSDKAFQLWQARKAGLNIPRSLITCNPEQAESFTRRLWSEGLEVVYKHAANAARIAIPTSILGKRSLPVWIGFDLHRQRFRSALLGAPIYALSFWKIEYLRRSGGMMKHGQKSLTSV